MSPGVVLTAFLVCGGNRGRADVVHKSGLRVLGAVVGSIIATGLLVIEPSPRHPPVTGLAIVVLLLAILAVGLWLRTFAYAAWALIVALVLSLLQAVVTPGETTEPSQLWMRVLAIICGATSGSVAFWFIRTIRSENVMRSRIAAVLAALGAFIIDGNAETEGILHAAVARLHEVAGPWNALEGLMGEKGITLMGEKATTRRPGRWVRLVDDSVSAILPGTTASDDARRAFVTARKALREPAAIGPALAALRAEIVGGDAEGEKERKIGGGTGGGGPGSPGRGGSHGRGPHQRSGRHRHGWTRQDGSMTQQRRPGADFAAPHPRLEELIAVLAELRAPGGCAWDGEQTHESLVRYLVEETYELIDAIESGNRDEMIEELGDVLYQVIFHSDIAAHTPGEEFTLEDVATHMTRKMIGRHPHVFGDAIAETADDVIAVWDELKRVEKPARTSVLDGVPQGMPALALADKLLGKAEKLGMLEQDAAPARVLSVQSEDELGPLLLAIVTTARANGLDAERALRNTLRGLQDEIRATEGGTPLVE